MESDKRIRLSETVDADGDSLWRIERIVKYQGTDHPGGVLYLTDDEILDVIQQYGAALVEKIKGDEWEAVQFGEHDDHKDALERYADENYNEIKVRIGDKPA